MTAGLQCDVESRAPSAPSRLPQGHHLSMGAAGAPVIPRAEDFALVHDDCAHRWIRAGLTCTAPGQRQGLCHETLVLCEGQRCLRRRTGRREAWGPAFASSAALMAACAAASLAIGTRYGEQLT